MHDYDLILIGQSEIVNYDEYSKLPLDRLPLYTNLVYPRMVYYKNGFRSHIDIINKLQSGIFWNEANFSERRNLLSIWSLPGFSSIHLANYLLQFGIKTWITNNFDREWDVFREIYENCDSKPIVGISTTFHLNFVEVRRITRRLKEIYPNICIVLGGAFVNDNMERKRPNALAKALKKYDIDFAVHSFNSETDLKELILWRNYDKKNLESINNLMYRTQENGKEVCRQTKSLWNNPVLEDTPFLWDQLNLPFLNTTIQLRTSASCPFKCAFCSYPKTARAFKTMSVETVEKHIQCIKRLPNIDKIIFLDDTFNVPVDRFRQLCKMFAKYDFEWFSFLRVQYVDQETARVMKESGCRGVYLGVESANDGVLKNMNKKATRKAFVKGIGHLKQNDITTMAAFVLGFPGETKKSIRDNVEFIENTGVDFYTLKKFYYMETAPVHFKREEFGLTGMGDKWSHNTMNSDIVDEHEIAMFKEIRNSVFVDADTSLWYIAYLYDQGFSMDEIASIQRGINELMVSQLEGGFNDENPVYTRIRNILKERSRNN